MFEKKMGVRNLNKRQTDFFFLIPFLEKTKDVNRNSRPNSRL